ncbi:lipid A biosynthesis lauroyl acyltransferase [Cellvibrio zantedeschiae]|uniref:Lipid A biosynthesis lauroyl acyltransferase n=2 Tax=Cellvibrio zantedeschiae TaxID=1237077 RepID=A0ABQ3B348_9GAMM|nr:lipid A biosynthesis lauroyl acyltransferase [Cellvibrio zantedeschiae]
MWLAKGRSHRITLKNIRTCFPQLSPQETQKLTHQSLIETAKTAAEVSLIWRNSWSWLESKIVAVEGEDILRAELAKGRGLIALAPHLGNWEVIAPYLASVAPLTAMYQPVAIPAMDKLILAGRSKSNINMAPTNRKGVLMLLKALQQGNIVGILPDQLPKKDAGAELASFFGQETLTMSLVHSLITRTQSRAIALFAKRVPGGFKVIVLPADEAIYSEDPLISIRGLNASVENCVHLAPAQYQWEYNRFRFPKSHQLAREQKRNLFACKQHCDTNP